MENKHTCTTTYKVKRVKTNEGKLINQYLVIKKIGEGTYSKIRLCKDTVTAKLYAMKKFSLYLLKKKTRLVKDADNKNKHISVVQDIRRQAEIMKLIDHPNVVKTYQILDDIENGKLYFIMDYCQIGEISSWNSKKHRFQTKQCTKGEKLIRTFRQILQGMQYILLSNNKSSVHSRNIIHRDLKPQNILIDAEGTIKIIDFGRAVVLKQADQKLKGSEGTYQFMSPECLTQVDKTGYDGRKADLWSLGVTLFCICTQTLPFDAEPILRLFEKIEKGEYEYPKQATDIPDIIKKCISAMLVVDANQRASLEDIVKLMN